MFPLYNYAIMKESFESFAFKVIRVNFILPKTPKSMRYIMENGLTPL